MALSAEEKAQLEALQAKESEPEADEEYIEIWDETGAGAKVKRSSAKSWLNKFGIDLDEITGEEDAEAAPPKKRPGGKPATTGNVTHAAKYFGGNKAS